MSKILVLGESTTDTAFGTSMRDGLKEAAAWKRGEISLPVVNVPSFDPDRIKATRKAVAKSSSEFARRFGIPARTLEGWEQGRRQPDPTACVLLRVIEKNAAAVEDALAI
jgi:putative transcriptional regulator